MKMIKRYFHNIDLRSMLMLNYTGGMLCFLMVYLCYDRYVNIPLTIVITISLLFTIAYSFHKSKRMNIVQFIFSVITLILIFATSYIATVYELFLCCVSYMIVLCIEYIKEYK